MERAYIAIDMKSFYASVECVARGLDPLKTDLLVADNTRSDQTICLAVSPSLKAKGVPGRPRLFEAKRAIREWEAASHQKISYITAMPRMAEYERISAQIFGIFLRYAAPEDVHVYSIDECFIDCTGHLHRYRAEAERLGIHPARLMAVTMIREVLSVTGITATCGIGANLYLAKVAMDIVAKKTPPDADGVRIAELNEESYRYLLWDHRPLTDFWQVGPGKARKLQQSWMFTMGDIAARTQVDEEWFYRVFGVDGEILIDHAWGLEPVTMADIKGYRTEKTSLSHGQVLPRAYRWAEARVIMAEMCETLCAEMVLKGLESQKYTWYVSYDFRSLEVCPAYDGPVTVDFYGRLHPVHHGGTVSTQRPTNSFRMVSGELLDQFDRRTDRRLLFRRLNICAEETGSEGASCRQLDLFMREEDFHEREYLIQKAMVDVRKRYGTGALFRGLNLTDGATTLERNQQIGGHRAGEGGVKSKKDTAAVDNENSSDENSKDENSIDDGIVL